MNHTKHYAANVANSTQDRGGESSDSREAPTQPPAVCASTHGGHGAVQDHADHGGVFGHFGHMFHMAPMVLILLAPRLGTRLTVVLAVALAAYFALTWARRRRSAAGANSMSGASHGQNPADVPGVELEK